MQITNGILLMLMDARKSVKSVKMVIIWDTSINVGHYQLIANLLILKVNVSNVFLDIMLIMVIV